MSKRCALFCNYRGKIWASYFENFCQQANSNIFSSPWTCLTKKQYGHLQLITLCQYTLCSNAFFGSWFMFIYKLGIEPKHNSKPFLFYQSLQEILLRVKIQRLSHVYPAPKYLQLWSAHIDPPSILQYLSFFASRVLWKWFFCVENQVKITYLVVAIYQACDCFLLEPLSFSP